MAQSRSPQQRGRQGNNGGSQPWNVLYPRQYVVNSGGSSENKTEFMRVGVAFPLRERQGFSLTLYLTPQPIDGEIRLVLMPRESDDDPEQDGRR